MSTTKPSTDQAESNPPDEEKQNLSNAKGEKSESKILVWIKTNLDVVTLVLMFKGSLPPVLVLCFYQSETGVNTLGTLGYLSAIISILSMPMFPRAKFLQTIFLTALATGIGSALAVLIVYSATKARQHSTAPVPPGTTLPTIRNLSEVPYNTAASAVSAVWFFVSIYIINILRGRYPQTMFSIMCFSIQIIIASTYAPLIPNLEFGYTFVKSLLKAFYLGLGFGTGVSLFIIPLSSRAVVNKQFTGFLASFQRGLKAHKGLFEGFGDPESFKSFPYNEKSYPATVKEVKDATDAMLQLSSTLQVNLPFAKREIGVGKLGPDELKQLNKLSRLAMLPLLGLASVSDVLNNFATIRGWKNNEFEKLNEPEKSEREAAMKEWATNLQLVAEPFADMYNVLHDAVDHVLYQLELKPKPKPKVFPDIETPVDTTRPGEVGFASYLDEKSSKFYSSKHLTLIEWARVKGYQLPDDYFDHENSSTKILLSTQLKDSSWIVKQRNQRQLFLLLYMEFLIYSCARSLLDLVIWSDKLVEVGMLKRNRLIIPNMKRLKKLFLGVFKADVIAANDDADFANVNQSSSYKISLGSSFDQRKDPEHLPPRNLFERIGNNIRVIPKFLKSPDSGYGVRVACAATSIGIISFLRQTQAFSFRYRLFWAVIMTSISMSPTSGQSVFGFILRLIGTVTAMLLSWFIYYVPYKGKTVGVIVLYWFFVFLCFGIVIKKPILAPVGIITIITMTLIIGYELEADKLGTQNLEISSGQVYLPALILGPVRLATVAAGLSVAFIWTMFPYPISEHSLLRQEVGSSLQLLAHYYSIIHETVAIRIQRLEGDKGDKNSPGSKLEAERLRVFNKQILLVSQMKTNSVFTKWEFALGGRFPVERYDSIISAIEAITRYMSLIGYASRVYSEDDTVMGKKWSEDFRRLLVQLRPVSHENVTTFSLLSGAIRDGRALPPYFPKPKPFALLEQLENMDADILSISHVDEPGYAAFAVLQLASRCVGLEVEKLIEDVTELVGVVDYSVHVERNEKHKDSDKDKLS